MRLRSAITYMPTPEPDEFEMTWPKIPADFPFTVGDWILTSITMHSFYSYSSEYRVRTVDVLRAVADILTSHTSYAPITFVCFRSTPSFQVSCQQLTTGARPRQMKPLPP